MLWAALELPGRSLWFHQQGEAIVFPSVWISLPIFCPSLSLSTICLLSYFLILGKNHKDWTLKASS